MIDNVKIDNAIDLGPVTEFSFPNVGKDHSIVAYFRPACSIKSATFASNTSTVKVKLTNAPDARLVCAVYKPDGTMAAVKSEEISADDSTVNVQFSAAQIPSKWVIRIMIVDSNWKPLCDSFEINN